MQVNTEYMSIQQLSVYLGVSDRQIRRWIQQRKIPFVKTAQKNGQYKFKISRIDQWLKDNVKS
jgi:excisionase family DNA binding protein